MIVTSEIQKLQNTNSSKEKLQILKSISDETKEFLRLCYNPRITFGIKAIPNYKNKGSVSLQECVESVVRNFASRKLSGHAAIFALEELLSVCVEPEMLERLIKRDAKCGVNVSLLNKAFGKDFIKEIPCMLAQPMNEKTIKHISFPAISQVKCDGMRCIIIKDGDNINAFSRNGSPLEISHILDIVRNLEIPNFPDSFIIDGEIIGIENGEIMSRQESNGLCNKLIRNTIKENELKKLGIQIWDFIESEDDKTLYEFRFEKAAMVVRYANSEYITLVESRIVPSLESARADFNEKLSRGLEGIILKNLDNVWENKRSKDIIKFKEELTIDLKVIDVLEGDGEFKGGLGALVCETEDGLLRVNIGTGFTLEERGLKNDLSNGKKEVVIIKDFESIKKTFMGEIVEVMYNAIIEDKNSDVKSLFLPRFLKVRKDKSVANKLNEI